LYYHEGCYGPLGYNSVVIPTQATPEGTLRFASRFAGSKAAGFYTTFQGLQLSTLGLGTYLGNPDERTDRAYEQSIAAAVHGGINCLDTAINYRNQQSERSIGAALERLFGSNICTRDEVFISSKAGFLTPGAIPSLLRSEHVAGGMHSMEPAFLADQIGRSLANLRLQALDVFYLHNPETQLAYVDRSEFEQRIRAAFATLERIASEGKIAYYGTATWDGYRRPAGARDALNLTRLLEMARDEGGPQHRFRFIQLPFNLAMVEAFGNGLLEQAVQAKMAVVASASLLQARLARDLPEGLAGRMPGLVTDAQRAIQFTRSTPGITVALTGMSNPAHVAENLAIANVAPLSHADYFQLFERA
jgi:aryl-alcohol dehydrogenase-like predicted oxidoreductase